ncbi:MAG: cysteine synthase A [Clostridia bacterium]|nr:MAG: cysteine synthase A [Clostridia bacterium]
MVKLGRFSPPGRARILAKLEFLNPGRSVKDRIARHMVEVAEREGRIPAGGTIIEATSGNTGIGLALVAAARGYHLVLVMPETMSQERISLLRAGGATVHLTPGDKGMAGSVELAERLLEQNPGWFMPRQFENPANPETHRLTTGPEILRQLPGPPGAFVAGVGTGGTITGVGEILREKFPGVRIVAVEPAASPVLSGGRPGPHKIQGIGAGFVPPVLNRSLIDEIITVSDADAYRAAMEVGREEGLLVGISSGAALYAARRVAASLAPGQLVLTILPDTGERYLSLEPYFRLDLRGRAIPS